MMYIFISMYIFTGQSQPVSATFAYASSENNSIPIETRRKKRVGGRGGG